MKSTYLPNDYSFYEILMYDLLQTRDGGRYLLGEATKKGYGWKKNNGTRRAVANYFPSVMHELFACEGPRWSMTVVKDDNGGFRVTYCTGDGSSYSVMVLLSDKGVSFRDFILFDAQSTAPEREETYKAIMVTLAAVAAGILGRYSEMPTELLNAIKLIQENKLPSMPSEKEVFVFSDFLVQSEYFGMEYEKQYDNSITHRTQAENEMPAPSDDLDAAGFYVFPRAQYLKLPSEKDDEGTEEKEKEEDKTMNKDYEAVKKGEFVVPYEWTDKQRAKMVPMSYLESYAPVADYFEELNVLHKRCLAIAQSKESVTLEESGWTNILIAGKPGTGKTSLARALAASLQLPYYVMPTNKYTEEGAFQGETKPVDGRLAFVTTPFLEAFENGGIVVLEEINLSDPNIAMGVLGQAIEPPFTLLKNGYSPITRHPLCIVIGTMNVGTQGSKPLNAALVSRFNEPLVFNDPKEEDFLRIMEIHGHSRKNAASIYTAYSSILSSLDGERDEEAALYASMRGCFNALEAIEQRGMSFHAAAEKYLARPLITYSAEVYADIKRMLEEAAV